jgi:universal stress protein A
MSEYKHILCAADFSASSELAAQRAVQLAKCFNARLSLLHVIDYFPEDVPVDFICPEDKDPAEHLKAHAEDRLRQLLEGLDYDEIQSEVIFSNHSAAWELAEYAKPEDIDLIVIGSHGRHGLSEILGSTSSSLAHRVTCDLMVVRAS